MKFLERERAVLEQFAPGLDRALAELDFERREAHESPALELLAQSGAPKLVVPRDLGGLGATALEAVRFQRALGGRSPSLGVAATMHHYKIAMLVELLRGGPREHLLRQIIERGWLLASCGAEGNVGVSLFQPGVTVREVEGGLLINGSKKPCCMVWTMGMLTMLVRSPDESRYEGKLLILMIPADAPGIERRRFWKNAALAAAQSDEVVLRDVLVPHDHTAEVGRPGDYAPIFTYLFIWFELLVSGSYLGAASGLAERALESQKIKSGVKARLGIELESAMAALEGIAHEVMAGHFDQDTLARTLHVRYSVQGAIDRATSLAAEALGGSAFATGNETTQLLAGARALAFHPPALFAMEDNLAAALAGGSLVMA